MEKRSIFALHGITGMLIATVLLLSIEGTLVYLGIMAERSTSQEYYYIDDAKSLKMKSTENASHMKLLKDKE